MQRAGQARGLEPSGEHAGRSVLVVDGSAAAREAIAELLREHGYDAHTAGSIQEMESVSRELTEPPELVFLEFRLCDGCGDKAAAHLRSRWPDVFIVYFSCLRPDDDQALGSALLAPATALLLKPTSLDAILQGLSAIQTKRGSPGAHRMREGESMGPDLGT